MKKIIIAMIVSVLLIAKLTSCSTDEHETIEGSGFVNPRQIGEFILYGKDDNTFEYYKPVSSVEESKIGSKLLSKVNFSPLENKNVFDYDEKLLFVVEHEDNKSGQIFQHLQLQYFSNDQDFIIFSAYEVMELDLDLINQDKFGNEINIYQLDNETAIQVELTTNMALTYHYYYYSEEDNSVNLVSTAVNEIYTYKDGILYHVAYTNEIDNDVLIDIFDRFTE